MLENILLDLVALHWSKLLNVYLATPTRPQRSNAMRDISRWRRVTKAQHKPFEELLTDGNSEFRIVPLETIRPPRTLALMRDN